MGKGILKAFAIVSLSGLMAACASNDRQPTSYSRAGRPYKEPKAMNHRTLDSNSLYQACIRERPEASCRNRLGR